MSKGRFVVPAILLTTALGSASALADDLKRGRAVYRDYCAECHGKQGRGDGAKAQRLGFRPRDFTLGAFKCRSTPTGVPPTDADLERTVARGLPGTAMRGLDLVLSADDRRAVIAYIKTLAPVFEGASPVPLEFPAAPDDLAELAPDGRRVYQVLRCWTCHGASGRGDGPAAAALIDDWGEQIRVFNFAGLRLFKCGGEPEDLYRTLHTGLTGSPMPSYTEAFRFAREDAKAVVGLDSVYDAEAIAGLPDWAAGQPERAAIDAVPAEEVQALVEHRTWVLIAYLRSLTER